MEARGVASKMSPMRCPQIRITGDVIVVQARVGTFSVLASVRGARSLDLWLPTRERSMRPTVWVGPQVDAELMASRSVLKKSS